MWASALRRLRGTGEAEGPTGLALDGAPAHSNCKQCHFTHKAPGAMLAKRADESALCDSCHQASPDKVNKNLLKETSAIQLSDPQGSVSSHLEGGPKGLRSVPFVRKVQENGLQTILLPGCGSCHDPHVKGKKKLKEVVFDTQGHLVGTARVNAANVCYGCHAGREAVTVSERQDGDMDVGRRFSPGTASSHFIGRSAKDRPDLPSLNGTPFQGPLDCTSCHSSPPESGSRGPHSSPYPFLLVASYGTEQHGVLGDKANDLCYTCHMKSSIEGNQSFPFHQQHIQGFTMSPAGPGNGGKTKPGQNPSAYPPVGRSPKDRKPGRGEGFMAGFGEMTPCGTCHDPHGSPANRALLRFDPQVVKPSSAGGPSYLRTSSGHGSCTLSCHGHDHVRTSF